jgi:hypothetical protein
MDTQTILIIVGALLAVSELLSLIPKIKSNGIFTLVVNILKWFKEKLSK